MVKFDPSKDKVLREEKFKGSNNNTIIVSEISYNNSDPKIQLSRTYTDRNGEEQFAKFGRLTKDELNFLIPVLQKFV